MSGEGLRVGDGPAGRAGGGPGVRGEASREVGGLGEVREQPRHQAASLGQQRVSLHPDPLRVEAGRLGGAGDQSGDQVVLGTRESCTGRFQVA
jgi:hypothetical protein